MSRLVPRLLLVCLCQAALTWFLYRGRVVGHYPWAASDLVVFGLPLVIGFGVLALLLVSAFAKINAWKRGVAAFGLAMVCAVMSSFVGAIVGFNLYGT